MGNERRKLKMELRKLQAQLDDLCQQAGLANSADGIDNEEDVIDSLLNEFGIPCHLDGSAYIKTAVLLRTSGTVKKQDGAMYLYQKVARTHKTKRETVERAIRYAIGYAFDCGDVDVIRRYFGNAISVQTGRATNKQFIETMIAAVEKKRSMR